MSAIGTTVQAFLRFLSSAYNTHDKHNLSPVHPDIVTSDCVIQLVPAAFLKRSGLPPNFTLTHEQWTNHVAKQSPAIASSTMETHDTVIDDQNKKAVVHVRLDLVLIDGQTVSLEYVVLLHFRLENGEARVTKIVEFVDGEAAGPFQSTVEKLLANLAAKEAAK